MPTYEYECNACGHRFDAFQSMSEEPLTECPECSGRVQRLIGGGAGIIFKGSGFYSTDSRAAAASGAGKDGSDKAPDGAGDGDSRSGNGSSKSESASSDSKGAAGDAKQKSKTSS